MLIDLHRIAVGIGNPGGAKLTAEKVMRRGEQRRALVRQRGRRFIHIIHLKHELDGMTASRFEAVMLPRCGQGGDAQRKAVKFQLDMIGRAVFGRAEGLGKAQSLIKAHGAREV